MREHVRETKILDFFVYCFTHYVYKQGQGLLKKRQFTAQNLVTKIYLLIYLFLRQLMAEWAKRHPYDGNNLFICVFY